MTAHIWTNGAYCIAGAYLMLTGDATAGFWVLCLGIASWVAHERGGEYWHLDWAAMYAAFFAVIGANFGDLIVAWFSAPLIYALWRKQPQSVVLLAALFALSLLSCAASGGPWLLALSVFATGLFIRQMAPSMNDEHYDLCHGAWHIITAAGFVVLVA